LAAHHRLQRDPTGTRRALDEPTPEDGDDPDGICGTGEENRSFLSGHTVASFAAAGLVCSTHQHMDLWGGRAADVAACATFVGMATANAALRVASDNHWASDVIVSGGIGFAAGYVLPSLLRFGLGRDRDERTHVAVIPLVRETRGLALAGTL
jgi:membrane-associated phospholipid phosphatase